MTQRSDISYQNSIKRMIREKMEEGETIMGAVRYWRERSTDPETRDFLYEMAIEVAAAKPEDGKAKEIRFMPSVERYARWTQAAAEMGIPLTAWVQIMADGWTVSRSEKAATVPVQEPTQVQTIRERIFGQVGYEPFSKGSFSHLARSLGVHERKIAASVQSMVNSGRATLNGNTYQITREN